MRHRRWARPRRWVKQGVPSGMPLARVTNLRFAYSTIVAPSASTVSTVYMRANSVFDPVQATGGGQPMGFDQWAALYNHYVVLGSKINVQISYAHTETATDAQSPYVCGVYTSDDASIPYSTWEGFVEARRGTWRQVQHYQNRPAKLRGFYSCRKFFNLKNPEDAVQRIGANTQADPTDEAYFAIWMQPLGADSPSTTVRLLVTMTIDYCVKFDEPVDLVRS